MYATSPSWSIPKKYQNVKANQTPSPNGYHPENWAIDHSPSWKIGTSSKNKQNCVPVPGPGQYQTQKINTKPKYGIFGKQACHKTQTNQNPSPSSYSPNYKINRPGSPSVTISSSIHKNKQNTKSNNIPGPGHYNNFYIPKKSQASIKIGQQKRFVTQKVQGPGPQTYAPNKDSFKKVSVGFTKQQKDHLNHTLNSKSQSPGPGQYRTVDLFQSSLKQNRGYSISSKSKPKLNNQNPGPGQYNPSFNGNVVKSPYVSMKGKHQSFKVDTVPGPSQYFLSNSKKNQYSYSIGKQSRANTNYWKSNPGPGAYNPKSICTQTPKYSLYGSRLHQPKQTSPGPGSYNADKNITKKRPQSAKISNSRRCELQKSISPGPGTYQQKSRPSTPANSFSKQQRNKHLEQKTPGPADYLIKPIIGQSQTYSRT